MTNHAVQRAEERLNLAYHSGKRLADKALECGFRRDQFSGSIRRYLDSLYHKDDGAADNLRIYGDYVYIFSRRTLVTLFRLPQEHKGAVARLRARSS